MTDWAVGEDCHLTLKNGRRCGDSTSDRASIERYVSNWVDNLEAAMLKDMHTARLVSAERDGYFGTLPAEVGLTIERTICNEEGMFPTCARSGYRTCGSWAEQRDGNRGSQDRS